MRSDANDRPKEGAAQRAEEDRDAPVSEIDVDEVRDEHASEGADPEEVPGPCVRWA